jgi:hypothetical protein
MLADLSPEEQSFFDAGDAIDGPPRPESGAARRQGSRRRSRHSFGRRLRHKLRNRALRKSSFSVVLVIVAVGAGYWASMFVANRRGPDPTELGVESGSR